MAKTALEQAADAKKAIQKLKEIDQAFLILSDLNQRSTYDAIDTYKFIQNYAWTKNRLNENNLQKLKTFWARQHVNSELRKKLDFDNFMPELDIIWYTPFYFEEYNRIIKQKEELCTKTFDVAQQTRRSAILTASVSGIMVIAGLIMFFFTNLALLPILLVFTGGLGLTSAYLLSKQHKTLLAEKETGQATVKDKWITIRKGLLGKLKYFYVMAFEHDGKKYCQNVPESVFLKTKTGDSVQVKIYNIEQTPPVLDVT